MVIVTCKCLNITANISVSDKDVDLLAKPFPTNGGPVSPSATLVPNTLEFLKEVSGLFGELYINYCSECMKESRVMNIKLSIVVVDYSALQSAAAADEEYSQCR